MNRKNTEYRVLLVEDDPLDAELIERSLARQGSPSFNIQQVSDARSLQQSLREHSPDVVLANHEMPEMRGSQVLDTIAAHDPDIPVILVSDTITSEHAARYIDRGAADYVLKDQLVRLPIAVSNVLEERDTRLLNRELTAQLYRASRMEAMGRMAAGIAHDFNNLLTIIGGNAELLREGLSNTDQLDMLGDIQNAVAKGRRMNKQLMEFGAQRTLRVETGLDINDHLQENHSLYGRPLPTGITLSYRLGADLPTIWIDESRLEQVLLNLIINARDAIGDDHGSIVISTRARERGVELRVADTGCGVPDEIREQVFDPFFTTKGKEGTGLGLATTYRVVQSLGGTVDLSSRPGRGATFVVWLPHQPTTDGPVTAASH